MDRRLTTLRFKKFSYGICQIIFILITTFFFNINISATCASNGDITGLNGQITLGTAGCATNSSDSASVFNTAIITSTTGDALLGYNVPWTIVNSGSIVGDTDESTPSAGIYLDNGGSVTNQVNGTIMAANGVGTSTNNFVAVNVNNSGTIMGTKSGLLLIGGGSVINQATGAIRGGFSGISFSDNGGGSVPAGVLGSVDNAGSIFSPYSAFADGIIFGIGGSLTNRAGALVDGFDAVGTMPNTSSLTVDNYGQIGTTGNASTGIDMQSGGMVTNRAGAQIAGGSRGITVENVAATIDNYGTILASGGRAIDIAYVPGIVNNYVGGILSGYSRAVDFDCPILPPPQVTPPCLPGGIVSNAGTMTGNLAALPTITYPTIEMHGANSSVTNTGTINGNVQFFASGDLFQMSAGQMIGTLTMGPLGNETALFQNVNDTNIGTISLFDGGGGGGDSLNFNQSSHTGGVEMIHWETINLLNSSNLTLSSNLVLGGLSADTTATLNINASTLFAQDGANIVIQSNSALAVLVNNAGTINLRSMDSANSLTVNGNYVGQSGYLSLNSVLNGDGAPSDKLVINALNGGGSATGNTFINVYNNGGTGALTNANGILLVQTLNDAVTDPTAFSLASPVRSGAYDYRLFRGGLNPNDPAFAQDWFLRSVFVPPPTPENLLPIIGPELSVYGSVLPTITNVDRVSVGTLHERVGDEIYVFSNRNNTTLKNHTFNGFWMRALTQSYTQRYTSPVDPHASGNVIGGQIGIDVYGSRSPQMGRTQDNNLVGVYGSYSYTDPKINGVVTNPEATAYIRIHTGSIVLNVIGGGLYWTHFWRVGAYIDLVGQGSYYTGRAHSNRTSLALRGGGATASAESGYPLQFAKKWSFEPQIQVMYQYVKIDKSSDRFSDVDIGESNTVLGRIGARLKYANDIDHPLFQPYLRTNFWLIMAGDKSNTVYSNTDTINTSAKNSWAQLGGGITINITQIFSLYGYIDGLVGLSSARHNIYGIDGGLGLRANL